MPITGVMASRRITVTIEKVYKDLKKENVEKSKLKGYLILLFLLVAVISAFAIAAAGYFIALTISRPVETIAGIAKQVAGGDFTVEVDMKKRQDEIGQLAGACRCPGA